MLPTDLLDSFYPDFETICEVLSLVERTTLPDVTPECNRCHHLYDRCT